LLKITLIKNILQDHQLHYTPTYIANDQLRDTVFPPPASKQQKLLWKKIEEGLSQDSRIRRAANIIHGEQRQTWEWIAPIKK